MRQSLDGENLLPTDYGLPTGLYAATERRRGEGRHVQGANFQLSVKRTVVRRDNTHRHDRERGAAYDLYEIGPAVGAQEAAVAVVGVVVVGIAHPAHATSMAR